MYLRTYTHAHTCAAEHEESLSREQSYNEAKRQLAALTEELATQRQALNRAELRLRASEGERDRLAPESARIKQALSCKAAEVGRVSHHNFRLESRVAELEKRLEWERKVNRQRVFWQRRE